MTAATTLRRPTLAEAADLEGAAVAVALPHGFRESIAALKLNATTTVTAVIHVLIEPDASEFAVRGAIRVEHKEGARSIPLQTLSVDGETAVLTVEGIEFLAS